MKSVFAWIGLLVSLTAYCQEDIRSEYKIDIGNDVYFGGLENVKFTTNTRAYGIEGTRFVFDDFMPSNVYFSNKTMAAEKLMNYDCYMDQVVYTDGSDKFVLNQFIIDYIEFKPNQDSSIFFERIFIPDEQDVAFAKILYIGKSSLYKRYVKKLVVKDEQPTFNWDDKYANEYIIRTYYYVKLQNMEDPVQLPGSKKGLLKLLKPLGPSMKSFMKQEKISLKDDLDLIRLMAYYDTLVENSSMTQRIERH